MNQPVPDQEEQDVFDRLLHLQEQDYQRPQDQTVIHIGCIHDQLNQKDPSLLGEVSVVLLHLSTDIQILV